MWAYSGSTGAQGTAIGTGLTNTNTIIAAKGTSYSYAARVARACADGGFNDWYLPSKDELRKLWDNRVAINGNFSANYDYYWSSSEAPPSDDGNFAYAQSFYSGSMGLQGKSASNWRVRAIRSF